MHDMTKAERLADKTLIEQAKEANDPSGNLVVQVVGPALDQKTRKKIQKKSNVC